MLSVFNREFDANGPRHVWAYQFNFGRAGLALPMRAHRAGKAQTGQYPQDKTGLNWPMSLGQDRLDLSMPLVGKTGLNWAMPLGQARPSLVNANGKRQVWTCQLTWVRIDLSICSLQSGMTSIHGWACSER